MGRWTQYDEDEYRLPAGMQRVGYDADSGKYYFRDREGALWEGAEGAEYGEMRMVSHAPIATGGQDELGDVEAAPSRVDGYQPLATDPDDAGAHNSASSRGPGSPYRMLFPFFLLALRLAFYRPRVDSPPPDVGLCPGTSVPVAVQAGDTCWKLAHSRNFTLEAFLGLNPTLDCNGLMPGQTVCVPRTEAKS
ncbi:hypothetical protein WOLCODRAFT_135647 [Wolfiporia cocos MD-104 SS10]|uniref:LysM domain-containing protein n=1 Tax=Wolfiporia cocos (strain MD-104) TaxID=742152 RepID=A0A2H3IWG3_WOLCO|nr:hypothetical protein WOLCODRAFT_135647 [Wolfiporia cocos MD-104 SS10]